MDLSQTLNELLMESLEFIPNLIVTLIILTIGWIIIRFLQAVITKIINKVGLNNTITKLVYGETPTSTIDLGHWAGFAVFWIGVLYLIKTAFSRLNLASFDDILNFIPNIIYASLLFALGWLIANVAKQLIAKILHRIGLDQISNRAGLEQSLGPKGLSQLAGTLVYIVIFIPFIIASLDKLRLTIITEPFTQMLSLIVTKIPAVALAFLLIAIAHFLGRILSEFVTQLLKGLGFDNILSKIGLTNKSFGEKRSPSLLAGKLLYLALLLTAIIEALTTVGLQFLANIVTKLGSFSGQILIGVIVFAIGFYIANLVADLIRESTSKNSQILATAAKIGICIFTGAMALEQIGIADEIVRLAFTIILGAIGVGVALAFGLGGREQAAKILENLNNKLNQ